MRCFGFFSFSYSECFAHDLSRVTFLPKFVDFVKVQNLCMCVAKGKKKTGGKTLENLRNNSLSPLHYSKVSKSVYKCGRLESSMYSYSEEG